MTISIALVSTVMIVLITLFCPSSIFIISAHWQPPLASPSLQSWTTLSQEPCPCTLPCRPLSYLSHESNPQSSLCNFICLSCIVSIFTIITRSFLIVSGFSGCVTPWYMKRWSSLTFICSFPSTTYVWGRRGSLASC